LPLKGTTSQISADAEHYSYQTYTRTISACGEIKAHAGRETGKNKRFIVEQYQSWILCLVASFALFNLIYKPHKKDFSYKWNCLCCHNVGLLQVVIWCKHCLHHLWKCLLICMACFVIAIARLWNQCNKRGLGQIFKGSSYLLSFVHM